MDTLLRNHTAFFVQDASMSLRLQIRRLNANTMVLEIGSHWGHCLTQTWGQQLATSSLSRWPALASRISVHMESSHPMAGHPSRG